MKKIKPILVCKIDTGIICFNTMVKQKEIKHCIQLQEIQKIKENTKFSQLKK